MEGFRNSLFAAAGVTGVVFAGIAVVLSAAADSARGPVAFGPFAGDYAADLSADGQTVDLVWQSAEGSFHTRRSNPDGDWHAPERLPIPHSPSVLAGNMHLFRWDGRLILMSGPALNLWQHQPEPREASEPAWKETASLWPDRMTRAGRCTPEAGTAGLIVACATDTAVRVLSRTQLDGDSPWREVWDADGSAWRVQGPPALFMSGDSLHLLVSIYRLQPPSGESRLLHFSTSDGGRDWQTERVPIGEQGLGRAIRHFSLLGGDGRLWIAYVGRDGMVVQSRGESANEWSAPAVVTQQPEISRLAGVRGNPPVLFWIDSRHREKEWWGHVPFHELFRNQSPYWRNNDVFALQLTNRDLAEVSPLRVTSGVSYTDPHRHEPMRVTGDGDAVYVLREGRRQVGFRLEEFGAEPMLFVHRVSREAVP